MSKALFLVCLAIAMLVGFILFCVFISGVIFGDSINKDFVGLVALSFGCAILVDMFGKKQH